MSFVATYNVCANIEDSSEKDYGLFVEIATYAIVRRTATSSPRHSVLRAPLPTRTQNAATRCGVRQPCNEAKQWRGFLNYDMRMRLAMRPAAERPPPEATARPAARLTRDTTRHDTIPCMSNGRRLVSRFVRYDVTVFTTMHRRMQFNYALQYFHFVTVWKNAVHPLSGGINCALPVSLCLSVELGIARVAAEMQSFSSLTCSRNGHPTAARWGRVIDFGARRAGRPVAVRAFAENAESNDVKSPSHLTAQPLLSL
ncbi:hypothetical protein EVAR_54983_1 [Eumeta japonica]|uniref:Uncharacterized protein n=1 Tax=Eumeta variegata TaxID=151549 RepID=A0A4C1Z1M0_EUMVA|nr:hypothetical protein EVAR_54983_1 [Eumeta japonica]